MSNETKTDDGATTWKMRLHPHDRERFTYLATRHGGITFAAVVRLALAALDREVRRADQGMPPTE